MSPEAPRHIRERILNLEGLVETLQSKRSEGKKIGLVTGGFDIIHKGHVNLFRYAKDKVDVLIVGVEQDDTILLSKGQNRPINKLEDRCELLSELISVDYIFPVPFVFQYGEIEKSDDLYTELYSKLRPDFLITYIAADSFWELKKKRAQEMGMGFLCPEISTDISSSSIANKIQDEI